MDEQLFMMGMGLSLEEKEAKAIANFQNYEPEALRRDPINGYYLCDSYGKDSDTILDLAKRSGVKFLAHHNLTTLDAPELIHFGRKFHKETVEHKPKVPMLKFMAEGYYGPPTRIARWCCAKYKESAGMEMVKVFGVRAAESARRKSRWKIWTPFNKNNGAGEQISWVLNPILFWSDDDIWQYHKKHNVPYCSLYDEGFTRLGCIGCPMADKQRYEEFARWPKYEAAWKRAITRFYDKWHGVPRNDGKPRWFDCQRSDGSYITSGNDLWKWWMEEMPTAEAEDDCQIGLF